MVGFLRSVCTFWAHDHKDNVASAGWMSPEAVAHVLKMAPMTALMAVRHAGLSAVELQMPRLVCHSGWEMEFLTGRFRGRYAVDCDGVWVHSTKKRSAQITTFFRPRVPAGQPAEVDSDL